MLDKHQRGRLQYLKKLVHSNELTEEDQLALKMLYLYNYTVGDKETKVPLEQIKGFKIDLGITGKQLYLIFTDEGNERYLPLDISFLSGRKRTVRHKPKNEHLCCSVSCDGTTYVFQNRKKLNECIKMVHVSDLPAFVQNTPSCVFMK